MQHELILLVRQMENQARGIEAGLKGIRQCKELDGVDDALFTASVLKSRIVGLCNQLINTSDLSFLEDITEKDTK